MTEKVYLVRQEGTNFVKIGKANNVEDRLTGLQTGNPARLLVEGAIPGGLIEERAFHVAFAPYRVSGEWFSDEDGVIAQTFARHVRQLKEEKPRDPRRYKKSNDLPQTIDIAKDKLLRAVHRRDGQPIYGGMAKLAKEIGVPHGLLVSARQSLVKEGRLAVSRGIAGSYVLNTVN